MVPATTSIRQKSMPHVESPRLLRRRMYLIQFLCEPHRFREGRTAFAMRMRELRMIENEIERRGMRIQHRITLRRG
jgi:hypothetical protein